MLYGSASILCIFIAIILVAIGVWLFASSHKKKISDSQPVVSANGVPRKKKYWILPIVIALILAFWTIWGALFFLGVVWVLRKNPDPAASFSITDNEKKTARRIYTWLFFSPFLTVPIFLIALFNLSYNSSTTNERVLAALIPLLVHAPLLLGLTSKNIFVYRHTQQGILLIALRAGLASLAVNVGRYPEDGFGLFLLGNGALWFIGSIAGWDQISKAKCWFMERKGEKIILPESTEQANPVRAQEHLHRNWKAIDSRQNLQAVSNALSAFRQGDKKTRQEAIEILKGLGEVEKF